MFLFYFFHSDPVWWVNHASSILKMYKQLLYFVDCQSIIIPKYSYVAINCKTNDILLKMNLYEVETYYSTLATIREFSIFANPSNFNFSFWFVYILFTSGLVYTYIYVKFMFVSVCVCVRVWVNSIFCFDHLHPLTN